MPGGRRENDEKRRRTTLSMLALDCDVVELEGVVPSSSFCEREQRRMRERQSNTANNVKARTIATASLVSSSLSRGLRGQSAVPLPPLLGSFRTSRESSAGREADIASPMPRERRENDMKRWRTPLSMLAL